MWQKFKYFCFTSLNRLLKTVEVDDLSNSDKVKSTVTGSESQMRTSGILLIAISPTSIFAFFNNFLQCIPKESVADSLSAYRIWYLGLNTNHKLDSLDWLLVWGYTVELTFLCEFLMVVHELQPTNFQQVKSDMLHDWGGGLDYGQDLA